MNKAPSTLIQRLKFIGPSIIVTGSVVGSGSIALSPLLGAATCFALLWWLLLSLWSKPLIQAEISRYVIATNKTFLEAFSDMPGPKTNLRGKQASWLVWFMFVGVVPSASNNSNVFEPVTFLIVNTSLVVIAVELLAADIALNLICCPSFNP